MADKTRAPATEEPPKASGKGRSKLLLFFIPTIVLLGVGGYVGWSQLKGGALAAHAEKPAPPATPPPVVTIKPFVVNLQESGDMPRYLKLEFDLELRPGSQVKELDQRMSEIRDAVIVLLGSKRSQDLASVEGKDRLRDEIITRINSRLQASTANRVFFKEFIIQ
jgi:flagellar protein FliL